MHLLLAWIVALAAVIAPQRTWSPDAGPSLRGGTPAPPPAYSVGAAFDSARSVLVVFGGSRLGGYSGETWEWDGKAWRRASNRGPTPRNGPAMCYDPLRRVVVLFGGNNQTGNLRDTWEWDGLLWRRAANTGPSQRTLVRLAFDPKRGTVVMYGGMTGASVLGETWEWNGIEWTRLADGPPRHLHGFVVDAERGEWMTFGGSSQFLGPGRQSLTGETWIFADGAWRLAATDGPGPRDHIDMAFDAVRGRAVLYGGYDGTDVTSETWEWDGKVWTQFHSPGGPGERAYPEQVFDTTRGRVLLYGGFDISGPKNDLWEWDGAVWTRIG